MRTSYALTAAFAEAEYATENARYYLKLDAYPGNHTYMYHVIHVIEATRALRNVFLQLVINLRETARMASAVKEEELKRTTELHAKFIELCERVLQYKSKMNGFKIEFESLERRIKLINDPDIMKMPVEEIFKI